MKLAQGITVYVAESTDDKDYGIWHIDPSIPDRTPRSPKRSEIED